MRLVALLLLLAAPLLELALLIKLGQRIGVWPTLFIVVATAVAGILIVRAQGMGVMRRMLASAAQGIPPVEPAVEGALLFVAGALLISPGPIGDVLGLALLVPPLRAFLAGRLIGRAARAGNIFSVEVRQEPWTGSGSPERPRPPLRGSDVIEGEFERIDDKPPEPRKPSGDRRP